MGRTRAKSKQHQLVNLTNHLKVPTWKHCRLGKSYGSLWDVSRVPTPEVTIGCEHAHARGSMFWIFLITSFFVS